MHKLGLFSMMAYRVTSLCEIIWRFTLFALPLQRNNSENNNETDFLERERTEGLRGQGLQ